MKAVIYARYSSERQTEQSIEGQLRECYAYAKTHDITIVGEYIDRAISGKSDNRKDFQNMIKDSDKRAFDAVVVYKLDRFTRNKYDSAIYKARLKKNGVKVLSAKESIPDGPEGIILESLLEGMAEYYSEELSQKITRGMYESALKCHSTGGNIALGYRTASNKSFVIHEEEAAIVRKIYDMYDSGTTVKEICDELNSLGVRTSRGSKFNKNSLHTILHNEKYIGVYKCTIKGNKNQHEIRIEDGVPTIIDKELFERVQARITANRKAPAREKAKVNYLLSGKLYCGECGAGMVGESGTGKHGGKHYYYICVNKKRKKSCDKKTVKKDWLENLVVEETVKNVLQPDRIEHIAKRCVEIQVNTDTTNKELELLKKQFAETKKSIGNLMSAIEQGIVTKNTKARLVELERTQEKLEFAIDVQKVKRPKLNQKHILFMLSQFQRETDQPLETYNEDIIECFVHEVYLYDNKLYIVYNLTDRNMELLSSEIDLITASDKADAYCVCGGSDLDNSPPPNYIIEFYIQISLQMV